uniref:Mediator of RNA polymerase II transcription subunit 22 n=1 Tax=Setaria digitata TaxID=48799 RepID=A0A915PKA6_9BILA
MAQVSAAAVRKNGRNIATKALIVQEYKRRLKDNIKSLNDNFINIISVAKINIDDAAHKNPVGRMSDYYTMRNETAARAALMIRAADELLKLTHDLKEFLILHDFNFLSYAIQNAEDRAERNMDDCILRFSGELSVMVEPYRDPWQEYKSALDSLKKKFLKKPNNHQVLAELENLALRFQDEECEQYAGMCHIQMAKIYEKIGDWSMQYNHYLKAARCFKSAEIRNYEMNIFACSDHLNYMQDCYNRSIELILSHQGFWLAGLHCTELGSTLCTIDEHQLALPFLLRGAELLKMEFRSHLAALQKLAACQIELDMYTDALATIDDLWMIHMKNTNDPKFGYGEELLKDCEITSVLLLLHRKNDDISARHRLLLSMYDKSSLVLDEKARIEQKIPWKKIPPKDSSLSRDLYFHFYEFVMALRYGHVEMAQKSFSFLEKHFNIMCVKLAMKLLDDVMDRGGLDKKGFADKFISR